MTLTLCGLVLVLTACGSDDADGELRRALPFRDVQASEFVFENDPSFPDRGIFRVVTTEPMICAIAWGKTETLGNFNNSLAMSGTGIINHDVFLPGAEAGETYFFRVQGSTADGSFYETELMSFTLPEADAMPGAPKARPTAPTLPWKRRWSKSAVSSAPPGPVRMRSTATTPLNGRAPEMETRRS